MARNTKNIYPDKSVERILVIAGRIPFVLTIMAFLLIIAGALSYYIHFMKGIKQGGWIYRLFFLGGEWNIPTYFSVILLLGAFALLLFISTAEKKRKSAYLLHWRVLTGGFLLMAADELLYFHEKLGLFLHELIKCESYGLFYYIWVLVAIPIVILLAVFFTRFIWNLPGRTRIMFVVSGSVYLTGAVGFEMLGGCQAEKSGALNLTYLLFETIEESLEMFGVIFFIYGLLDYIQTYCLDDFRPLLK